VALERVFLSGDAAGYIEPFTGEGMAWALLGGRTVATLLPAAVSGQNERLSAEAWIQTYTQMIRQRQAVCHWTTRCLRHPWLIRAMAELLSRLPGLATPLIQSINTPPARSTLP
jgi:flavin-dependent dehydrogenase